MAAPAEAPLSREANILAIIQAIPVDHSQIRPFDNGIMDKFVAGMALSLREAGLHVEFMKKSAAYNGIFRAKILHVITLSDGFAKIYNLTKRIIGFIPYSKGDRVTINERPINCTPKVMLFWGKENFTDYAVFRELEGDIIEISVQEVAQDGKGPIQYTLKVDLKVSYTDSYKKRDETVYSLMEVPPILLSAPDAEIPSDSD